MKPQAERIDDRERSKDWEEGDFVGFVDDDMEHAEGVITSVGYHVHFSNGDVSNSYHVKWLRATPGSGQVCDGRPNSMYSHELCNLDVSKVPVDDAIYAQYQKATEKYKHQGRTDVADRGLVPPDPAKVDQMIAEANAHAKRVYCVDAKLFMEQTNDGEAYYKVREWLKAGKEIMDAYGISISVEDPHVWEGR